MAPIHSKNRRILLYACVSGFLLRLAVIPFLLKDFLAPGRDRWEFGYEMGHIARSLATGHGLADPYWGHTGPTALLTPVYPALMAAIFKLFGVFTRPAAVAVLTLNSIFSVLTILPIYFIARRCFDRRTAVVSAWVWALFPYSINFAVSTMWYHCLMALLITLIFLATLKVGGSNRSIAWIGYGALIGVTALTSPVVLDLVPFLFAWHLVERRKQKLKTMMPLLLTTAAMTMTVLPWTVRNFETFHRFVPLKDGFWQEVCVGNVGNTLHWYGYDHPSVSPLEKAAFARLGEVAYMDRKHAEAVTYLQAHPGTYAWRTVRRFAFMWTGFWSLNHEYLHEEPLDLLNMTLLMPFIFVAFNGLRLAWQSASSQRVAVLALLFFAIFPLPFLLTHVDPGYRHPLDPLLVIFAGYCITWSFERRKASLLAEQSIGRASDATRT